ncbi:hypothetical protein [Candidatus Synchoanobacter obligatus]|uniref:Yip1 domain-containing protein n=1 Tax=Candidatus Synchoanobacter obligatus TaxID=2919597 RepID=A0ABT1L4Y2_9GAMM|nr:hypothetical protein [Candidatus Synchoanobacter obligatus]MCP8352235.1 hypothetical protein [Candidatus Synchoanobacter obligatus]
MSITKSLKELYEHAYALLPEFKIPAALSEKLPNITGTQYLIAISGLLILANAASILLTATQYGLYVVLTAQFLLSMLNEMPSSRLLGNVVCSIALYLTPASFLTVLAFSPIIYSVGSCAANITQIARSQKVSAEESGGPTTHAALPKGNEALKTFKMFDAVAAYQKLSDTVSKVLEMPMPLI